MAVSEFAKKASDHIPYCKDQGIDYLMSAAGPGLIAQSVVWTQVAGGAFTFAGAGLKPMFDGSYRVFITNHTTPANGGSVAYNTRTAKGFTISGAATADVIDIEIIGKVAGELNR